VRTDDFSFDLPEELIAQFPPERRGESRLLVLDRLTGERSHCWVRDLPAHIEPGSLMVFNDSRVRKARLYGEAIDSGARVEFLLIRRREDGSWEAAATKLKRQRPGRRYRFPEGVEGEIIEKEGAWGQERDETRLLRFIPPIDEDYFERVGHIPLPPYIRRSDAPGDADRYQTVYARAAGSAASPTAGLHFTEELLAGLRERDISMAMVTLHVGLGTFLPVRSEHIEEHRMHEEIYSITPEAALQVTRAKAEGRPIVAVGTTSLRTLESAWSDDGHLVAGDGATSIFIYPGYRFKVVDRLFTNFHTPRSTLLMLVSAFAGRERILHAYEEAVSMRYRFFSYGDAMLIL